MSIKILGVLITTNSLLKAIESGAITMGEAAVSALLSSDNANAKAVATAVEAKIQALKADTTMSGLQKLEAAAVDALDILTTYGFAATKDFAIALVQTVYNKIEAKVEEIGHNILVALGIEKATA